MSVFLLFPSACQRKIGVFLVLVPFLRFYSWRQIWNFTEILFFPDIRYNRNVEALNLTMLWAFNWFGAESINKVVVDCYLTVFKDVVGTLVSLS